MRIASILFALILFATVSAVNAQTAEAYLAKCDASFEKGEYRDAVKHCTKALEAKPGFEEALITRAGTYKILRSYPAAIADYTELIRVTNGMAMAYFYRANIYKLTGKDDDAVADLTAAITKDPKGLFAARSYYERGLIFEKRGLEDKAQADYLQALILNPDYAQAKAKFKPLDGNKTLTETVNEAAVLRETSETTAPAKPVTPTAKTAPSPTAKMVPAAAADVPAAWKRMALTGTGISVASPLPYVLKSQQADPLLEKMEARVRWEMLDGSLWATVQYLKWDQGFTTVRQILEKTINIIVDDNGASARTIKDTTFLGESAAVYDQERYDQYGKKQVRQKMVVFGTPNTYVTLNFIHDAGDQAAAKKVDQLIASMKKEGAVAAAVSKVSPANWKTYNFGGLLFDFPSQVSESACEKTPYSQGTKVCGAWGDKGKEDLTIDITYRNYGNLTAPDVKKFAADHLNSLKEIMAKDTSWKEFKNLPYPINAGEAVKVSAVQAYDGTHFIFVSRGTERWQVIVWYFNRWDGVRDALNRVLGSVKFKL